MPIKAVIFDLDGTITRPFFDFDAIREEMGLAPDSGPILEIMEKMPPDQRKRTQDILTFHEDRAVAESALNDGARETLDALRQRGISIGILTRNKRCNAEAIARKHNLTFDAIVDREDGPVKPDAFGVLHLCEHFSTTPAETILVGDYLFDLLSAKAAGAVAVLLNSHKESSRFAAHADYTIASLDKILDIIDDTHRQ
ncbi:MAG: HAD family hydrolase [Planctomycetota bacterium]|jgi:HAD superfamily hydrolase (TIGR01509 family)